MNRMDFLTLMMSILQLKSSLINFVQAKNIEELVSVLTQQI